MTVFAKSVFNSIKNWVSNIKNIIEINIFEFKLAFFNDLKYLKKYKKQTKFRQYMDMLKFLLGLPSIHSTSFYGSGLYRPFIHLSSDSSFSLFLHIQTNW